MLRACPEKFPPVCCQTFLLPGDGQDTSFGGVRHAAPPPCGGIAIWRVPECPPGSDASAVEPGLIALLSPEEKARASRFFTPTLTRRYVRAHAALRLVLATTLDLAPDRLSFSSGPWGRPELPGVSFSLSHCNGMCLIAVSRDVNVGIDVESLTALSLVQQRELAACVLSAKERDWVASLERAGDVTGFMRLWCLREAVCKALGTGLSLDLAAFAIEPAKEGAAPKARGFEGLLAELAPAWGFAGALCVAEPMAAHWAPGMPVCQCAWGTTGKHTY